MKKQVNRLVGLVWAVVAMWFITQTTHAAWVSRQVKWQITGQFFHGAEDCYWSAGLFAWTPGAAPMEIMDEEWFPGMVIDVTNPEKFTGTGVFRVVTGYGGNPNSSLLIRANFVEVYRQPAPLYKIKVQGTLTIIGSTGAYPAGTYGGGNINSSDGSYCSYSGESQGPPATVLFGSGNIAFYLSVVTNEGPATN